MKPVNPIADAIKKILATYCQAYTQDYFSSKHAVFQSFGELATALKATEPVRGYPTLVTKWSVGQGRWALVPWLALLDSRTTSKVSEGTYVVILFRADMSGVYLTLNQGTTGHSTSVYGTPLSRGLHERTKRLRARCSQLADEGFEVGDGLDLRSKARLAKSYEDAVIALRFYSSDSVPPDKAIVADLDHVLAAYRKLS